MARQLNKYYRSFSGTDALVFIVLPNSKPIVLGSLSTISYSMYRDKKPVPVIGQINVGGVTRGTRVYAGTLIFTMISQHWLNDLIEIFPWIKNSGVDKVDELPLFDLMIVCANEYGATMQMMIYGADLTEEGQVLSIENLFTENTFSFIARDVVNFNNQLTETNNKQTSSSWNPGVKRRQAMSLNLETTPQAFIDTLGLEFSGSRMLESDIILDAKKRLNARYTRSLAEDKRYDKELHDTLLRFQSEMGLSLTGILDDETYQLLKEVKSKPKGLPKAKVLSEGGLLIRQTPSYQGRVLDRYLYQEEVDILALSEDKHWIQTNKGFIPLAGTFCAMRPEFDFQEVNTLSSNELVLEIQKQLLERSGEELFELTGRYDGNFKGFIKAFQQQLDLEVTGFINEETYLKLKEYDLLHLSDEQIYVQKGSFMFYSSPNTYSYSSLKEIGGCYQQGNQVASVKCTLISFLENGKKSFDYLEFNLVPFTETELTLELFKEKLEGVKKAEFIVYVLGEVPYKWTVNF